MSFSKLASSLPPYLFKEMEEEINQHKAKNKHLINLGLGTLVPPTSRLIINQTKKAIWNHRQQAYPPPYGSDHFRQAVARHMKRKYGVNLDPEHEITTCNGVKEAINYAPPLFLDPGQYALLPNPGYLIYEYAVRFAGGQPYFMPLEKEKGFLPDFEAIPSDVAKKAGFILVNYPNNPTGAFASRKYYTDLVKWARDHDIVIVSDEGAYADIYFEEKPVSLLSVAKKGVIAFYSLSKGHCMANYRVGWVCGDRELMDKYKLFKKYRDTGTPSFIQEAVTIALTKNKRFREKTRLDYKKKHDLMVNAFAACGLPDSRSKGTYYLWQEKPEGLSAEEFHKLLLKPDVGVYAGLGERFAVTFQGRNPGQDYLKFALMPPVKTVAEAAERIERHLPKYL